MRRYHGLDYVGTLDMTELVPLLKKAQENEQREHLWVQWCSIYPQMDKKHFVPFDKFCRDAIGADADPRSNAEILADVEVARRELEVSRC